MAELKTQPHDGSVDAFLAGVENEERREDCLAVVDLMKRVTGEEPKMWGPSIVGFGTYDYKYESGREGSWFVAGFAPRKQAPTIYIMSGFPRHDELMAKLGKYKTGKSCLYVKSLEDVDTDVLEELVRRSVEHVSGSAGES